MGRGGRGWLLAAVACAAAACGGGGGGHGPAGTGGTVEPPPPPPPPPPPVKPPVELSGFRFYSTDQGLTPTIWDVSADEAGNTYVAGGAAVFAKRPGDRDFARFDPAAAGFTANCWDEKDIANPTPAGPPRVCPVISVAGALPGKAAFGLQGVGLDYDYDAEWARRSGGADLVSFDGTKLAKDRHVFIASPPGMVCEHWANPPTNTVCASTENYVGSTWVSGRKGKGRQVLRIVVNHDKGRPTSYGDVMFGSVHAVISILAAHPDQRGWVDSTKGDPEFADTKGLWEHEHPAIVGADGRFLTGQSQALAIDPTTNVPWFANEVRIASLPDYASVPHPDWRQWWGEMSPPQPFLAIWGSASDPAHWETVTGMSFCADGTLWVASMAYGLARRDPGGAWSTVPMPPRTDQRASAVACDTDGSVWVGFDYGGFGRLKNGAWAADGFVPQGAPAFAAGQVRSIQIDRWSSPRVVWFAWPGAKGAAGGLAAYDGP